MELLIERGANTNLRGPVPLNSFERRRPFALLRFDEHGSLTDVPRKNPLLGKDCGYEALLADRTYMGSRMKCGFSPGVGPISYSFLICFICHEKLRPTLMRSRRADGSIRICLPQHCRGTNNLSDDPEITALRSFENQCLRMTPEDMDADSSSRLSAPSLAAASEPSRFRAIRLDVPVCQPLEVHPLRFSSSPDWYRDCRRLQPVAPALRSEGATRLWYVALEAAGLAGAHSPAQSLGQFRWIIRLIMNFGIRFGRLATGTTPSAAFGTSSTKASPPTSLTP